jgi:hypothetical protein
MFDYLFLIDPNSLLLTGWIRIQEADAVLVRVATTKTAHQLRLIQMHPTPREFKYSCNTTANPISNLHYHFFQENMDLRCAAKSVMLLLK